MADSYYTTAQCPAPRAMHAAAGIRLQGQVYPGAQLDSPFGAAQLAWSGMSPPQCGAGPFGGHSAHKFPWNQQAPALPDSPTSWSNKSTLYSQSSISSTCSDSSTASFSSSCGSDASPRRVRTCSCPLPSTLRPAAPEPADAMQGVAQTLRDEIEQLLQLRQRIAAARAAAGAGTAAAAACGASMAKLQAALQHALAVRNGLQQSAMEAYAVQLQQCKLKIAAAANLKAQLPGNPAAQRHLQRVIAYQQRRMSVQQQLLVLQMGPQA